MRKIADVEDMRNSPHRNPVPRSKFKASREDFIAHKQIILVAEDRMRAGKPAGAIEFVVVKTVR